MKNMVMRACAFKSDGSLLTLCVTPREPSFIIKWRQQGTRYQPEQTAQVHKMAATGLRLNHDQTKVCVMTSDGFANLIDSTSLKSALLPKKSHNMPLTACAFLPEQNRLVTVSTDYSYKFTRMTDFSYRKSLQTLLFQMGVLLVILVYVADYLF